MLVNRELDFIKEAFLFMNATGQLSKPKNWPVVDYYYFLQHIGFEKGDQVMRDQGFPGEAPETFNVARSSLLTPEEFFGAL